MADAKFAAKVQFFTSSAALITGALYLCFLLVPQYVGFYFMVTGQDVYLGNAEHRAIENSVYPLMWISLTLDSICNDVCTHYLAVYVVDDTLITAQRIAQERASRAADELRRYDVAAVGLTPYGHLADAHFYASTYPQWGSNPGPAGHRVLTL